MMKKEIGCNWRPIVGVLAIGVLAFGLSLQGAALHKGSAVSSERVVATATVTGTVATANESREPVVKVPGLITVGVDSEAMPLVEYPGADSEGGLRADFCTPQTYKGGDDCALATPSLLSPRSCSTTGAPCIFDADCPGGGDVCDTTNILYLSGDVSLATRIGDCSTTGLPCERDLDCNEGTCSIATTQGCHSDADCPDGETCVAGETCDNLPCSHSPNWRCTFEDGDTTITYCDTDDDCVSPRMCVHGDYGWWEGFVLEDCANVAVSYCCDGPQWVYGALYGPDGCVACQQSYGNDDTNFDLCEDAHRTFYYDGLPPGTYYQPVYAAGDPGLTTSFQLRLDAELALGACCTGAQLDVCVPNMSPCDCETANGSYLGDATTCGGDPCSTPGACCLADGVGCVEVTGAGCVTSNGYFAGPGTSCEEACCPVPVTGADDCSAVTPKAIPVPGYATFVGDASTATAACSIDPATGSWWDAFTLDECAEVMVDYCCTETGYGTVWWVLVDDDAVDCCDGATIMRDEYSVWGAGGTIANCDDGNFRMLFYELGPGTYYLIVHEAMAGPYTMHVTTTALAPTEIGACCVADPTPTCLPDTCQSECLALDGTWLGGGTDCGPPDPCLSGACCDSDGSCANTNSNGCVGPDQIHHPGIQCANFRCPTWGADECDDAQLITDCDGVALQGYNGNATARWGTCSTSGAPCYTSDGLTGDDSTCPGPSDDCVRDAFGDPFYSCFWGTGNTPGLNTVWYKFVAVESSIYIATCNSGVEDPAFYDSALVLYEGTCNGGLVEMTDPSEQYDGCGEDECPYSDPNAPWLSEICYCQLVIGQTYYIEVINAWGVAGQFQLDLECPCIDCLPGACCETLGNRCFDYDGPYSPYAPVGTANCTVDNDCVGTATECASPGDCICLPYFLCTEETEPLNCPTDPNALAFRYGGNGTVCEIVDPGDVQIDPPCGVGACCDDEEVCQGNTNPLECLGDVGQGNSWNGEGSTCLDFGGPLENEECPKACMMDGYGHPNDGNTLFVSDVSANGVCSGDGVTPCVADVDCQPVNGVCNSGDTQAMADSFVPTETGVSELCWWGTFRNQANTDCGAAVHDQGTMHFDIVFWEDTDCDGIPDNVVAQYLNQLVDKSTTGMPGLISAEWEFHTSFTPVALTPDGCYYLEIAAADSPDDCDFLWLTSTVGDGNSAVDLNAVDGFFDTTANFDMAWMMDTQVADADCAPTNDNCVDVVALGTTLSNGASVPFNTTTATDDGPAHPKNSCEGTTGIGNWAIRGDLWYLYTAECAGTLTVDICTSGYDTGLVVYNYGAGPWQCPTLVNDPNIAACCDDSEDCGAGSQQSQATVAVAQGDHILIRVAGNQTATGCGLLKVDLALDPGGCFDDSDCPDNGAFCDGTEFCNLSTCECESTGDPCPDDGLFCTGVESCNETLDQCESSGDPCAPDPCLEDYDTCGGGPTDVNVVSAETCFDHGAGCLDQCLPLDCDVDSPYDNIEPRLQLGTPPTVKLHCDGVPTGGTCTVSGCSYAGSCTVSTDATTTATVTFGATLPNTECCTLTFTNGILGARTIIMLEGDVNKDGAVGTADSSSVKARLGQAGTGGNVQYDIDRDCSIATADKSSVKGRLNTFATVPCPCP